MPSSLAGLVIFVWLLSPGLAFVVVSERTRPSRQYSPFRETGVVVLISLMAEALVVGAFAGVRILFPERTPDVGELVRSPDSYFSANYAEILVWSGALLVTAIFVGILSARPPVVFGAILSAVGFHRLGRWVEDASTAEISRRSGWGEAFSRMPKKQVSLGVEMADGTFLYGPLLSYNPQIDESKERTLQLTGPLRIRYAGHEDYTVIDDVGALIVSADQIVRLQVYYRD